MNRFIFILFIPLSIFAQNNYTQYVDPFVGTGGHGHTYPGATLPFGMVQLSPDTRLKGWDGCSGYHYSDNVIYGFSHTHLSGVGASDYGDVLLMPTVGTISLNNNNYSSTFDKKSEVAKPGYYAVFLDKPKVKVELTSTLRTGLHQYTFPASEAANFILDLTHRDKLDDGELVINGNDEIAGYRISTKWTSKQRVYFVIQFSKPFKQFGIANGKQIKEGLRNKKGKHLKCYVRFATQADEKILVRVGISAVSIDGARKNLEAELPNYDFVNTRQNADITWNKELNKIEVETKDESKKRTFYTALYHALLTPNIYQDVDGQYLGRDRKVHTTSAFDYFTVFSLWDTYRALHPLLAITDRKRTTDFVNTFITQYEQGGLLPVWEFSAYETFMMIGYHAVPVILDAYAKGIDGFDTDKALKAMLHSATIGKKLYKKHYRPGPPIVMVSYFRNVTRFDDYLKLGYIKQRIFTESVSRTLEYAYDDWCIAQMAQKLSNKEAYDVFIKRAKNYQNLFDTKTGFMRPRRKKFITHFNPYAVTRSYTEGNAWQYAFYVPQDISGHIKLLGGKEKFSAFLDTLFTTSSELKGHKHPDVSGMIGQYAHGNEPSHQIAYEYNYVGQPWKTQKMVRQILQEMYSDKPDGLSGNEDCGQMSAWYIFSALGFYPVCPGSTQYAVGSPLFDKAIIHLENGKTFTIQTTSNSDNNVYIQNAKLNNIEYTHSYLNFDDIKNGGVWELNMGAAPNKEWGSSESDVPVTRIE